MAPKVSPKLNILAFIIVSRTRRKKFAGKFVGSSTVWELIRLLIVSIPVAVWKLVYIAVVSAVNIFAFGGMSNVFRFVK